MSLLSALMHRVTVTGDLRRRGVKLRGQSMTETEIDRAAALYAQGWSVARIGGQLDFNGGTVWRALQVRGTEMRSASGRTQNDVD